jgi:hypothetical protein
MRTIWGKPEDAEQQRNIGTGSTPQANQDHRRFEDLGEEESKLQRIKRMVEHDEPLSQEDETFLTRLVERANEWQKGLKSSSDTEPEDTMSG